MPEKTSKKNEKNWQKNFNKVLVIGIDGMDPRLARKLMIEGKLPNFKKLADAGGFQELKTSNPAESPVAWTTIATGKNPGEHGIFDFITVDKDNYLPMLSLSKAKISLGGTSYESTVKADTFWEKASELGISSSVIRWPLTFPPKEINGKIIAGLGVTDIQGLLSGYSYYEEKTEDYETVNKEESESKGRVFNVKKIKEKDRIAIDIELVGPRTIKSGMIINILQEARILFENNGKINFEIEGEKIELKKNVWSPWIRARFRTGLFGKVNGIFKVHLESTEPFKMYVTSMNLDPEKPMFSFTSPKNLSKELAAKNGLFYTLGMPEETDGFVDGKLSREAFLKQANEIEAEREKLFWQEFEEFEEKKEKALMAFVFDSSDRLSHLFWNEKAIDESDTQIAAELEEYYLKKDFFLGEILKKLEHKELTETLLLIVSDHGFTAFEKAVNINNWLYEEGFMKLNQKEKTEKEEELEYGDKSALFRNVDWKRTKAYSAGFSSIYLNIESRQKEGIVKDSSKTKEKLMNEIITKLEGLKDEATGQKIIRKVYKSKDIYEGEQLSDAPDLIIGFQQGYRMSWENAIGGFSKETVMKNEKPWKADHLVDPEFVPGVLFSNNELKNRPHKQEEIFELVLDAFSKL